MVKRRRNTGDGAKKRFKADKKADKKAEATADGEAPVPATGNSNDTENKPTPELIQEAKYYLEQWQKLTADPSAKTETGEPIWRFKKAKQVWILRWMYRADVVNKALFTIVLEYLGGMQGTARDRVLREAQDVVDATKDDGEKVPEAEQTLEQKLLRRKLKRAYQIAKVLA
ncbi:hypothetical protein SDRG_12640 [Saprolegnia diclina VS20]|uniref:WKF domain-containing protein n=1 Tax=Saprolegnia diclina (strain VS20) TaxID=1156394 RepID=T0Q4V0_SAPDV|nr:hypothetical protein SDRG_12640 [Saprolegnia diclina VS20]EQC29636.1 hypothetical protein SDRG_12640 [Saprolegnia diclina VS20]|eukprot:XP_008616940.1 hypothetical protein SDRG_12640 [Saprolegnia diclina VS20]